MRAISSFTGIYLHRNPVDMRRSIDGLSEIVRHGLKQSLDGKYLFVFVGKTRDRLKIIYWDRTGYALWYKRLERGRFPWPKVGDDAIQMSTELFKFLLDGVDVFVKPHDSVEISRDC